MIDLSIIKISRLEKNNSNGELLKLKWLYASASSITVDQIEMNNNFLSPRGCFFFSGLEKMIKDAAKSS